MLVFLCSFILLGECFRGSETPPAVWKPPLVERCDLVKFKSDELDSASWKNQTQPEKVPIWFKEQNGWWWIDWDTERQPLRQIIIHHSASPPDFSAAKISEIQRERLYVSRYSLADNDPYVVGLPIHSCHVVKKADEKIAHESFIGYHHLIYADGRITTELQPLIKQGDQWLIDMVGWHATKWDINCQSIGICLVGDFTNQPPSEKQIKATNQLIAYYRSLVPDLLVEPHKNHTATKCPGDTWDQWKDLIK